MSERLRLTVPATKKHAAICVRVDSEKVLMLAPAPDGGATITIPTRSFVVSESIEAVLFQWLGPGNGDGETPSQSAAVGG